MDDTLSIGAGLSLLYATSKQDIFPKTSVFDPADPARSFFGYKLRDHDFRETRLAIEERRDDVAVARGGLQGEMLVVREAPRRFGGAPHEDHIALGDRRAVARARAPSV